MPENQTNSQQLPEETGERAPHLMGRSNALAAFILTKAVLASPIALAAGAAIFQSISNGEVSPAADFWLKFSLLFAVPMMVVAAIQSVASEKIKIFSQNLARPGIFFGKKLNPDDRAGK